MSSQPPNATGAASTSDAHPDIARTAACIHSSDARNLVLNLDGTANQFGSKSTNVVELFSRLIKLEGKQLVYYDSGIGTYARPSFWSLSYLQQCIVHTIDTAIAWNFENIVHAAYQWLSENYQPGDRIYLFGFSRGAYQARVIAGMIEKVGLLHKGNNRQIPFAYELYCSVNHNKGRTPPPGSKSRTSKESSAPSTVEYKPLVMPGAFPGAFPFEDPPPSAKEGTDLSDGVKKTQSPSQLTEEEELCAQFKKSLCHDNVKVHFVGAWDTVSSIGVFRGKSLPETVSGMGHVCHFRHALALDERRAKFQPEYVNGGLGPREDDQTGDVKEVWFAGSHSDIGGGNIGNAKLTNFGPSLRWMTYEAMLYGLHMKPYEGKWEAAKRTESLTYLWKALEYLPFGALTYDDENSVWYWPHLGEPRRIQPRQSIHQSVFSSLDPCVGKASPLSETVNSNHTPSELSSNPDTMVFSSSSEGQTAFGPLSYTPRAILPGGIGIPNWNELFYMYSNNQGSITILEKDPFENVTHMLNELDSACKSTPPIDWPAFQTPLSTLSLLLNDDTRRTSLTEVPSGGRVLLTALQFAYQHQKAEIESRSTIIRLLVHAREIPQEDRSVKTSEIRQWKPEFAVNIKPIHWQRVLHSFGNGRIEHYDLGFCVHNARFYMKNPRQVALNGCRRPQWKRSRTLIFRDSGAGPDELEVPQRILSLSNDGSHAAALDDSQRMGVIETTSKPPSLVLCVEDPDATQGSETSCDPCFTNDNQMLGAGYTSGRIKLWRKEAGRWELSKSSKASEKRIVSLGFSRNGSRLAFHDSSTMRIWTLGDDAMLEWEISNSPLQLAWRPSGNWIASGDTSGGVTIWSTDQGKVIHCLKAHDDWARSVKFRYDGEVLATGSDNGKIRVWKCGSWEKLWEFTIGSIEYVMSLAFSPDGKQLLSGGDEGSVDIWDVETDLPYDGDMPRTPTTSSIPRQQSLPNLDFISVVS